MSTGYNARRLRGLIDAQGGICAGCGGVMVKANGQGFQPNAASRDHVIPKAMLAALGIDHLNNNSIALHQACNNKKDNALPNGCHLVWLIAGLAYRDITQMTVAPNSCRETTMASSLAHFRRVLAVLQEIKDRGNVTPSEQLSLNRVTRKRRYANA